MEKKFTFRVVLMLVTPFSAYSESDLEELRSLVDHMVGTRIDRFNHLMIAFSKIKTILVGMFPGIDGFISDKVEAEADRVRSKSGKKAEARYWAKLLADAQAKFGQDELSIPAGCAAEAVRDLLEQYPSTITVEGWINGNG